MLDKQSLKRDPLNHTKKLGNHEFAGYLKSQIQTVQLYFSIQKYLQTHPFFYIDSLLSKLKGKPLQFIRIELQKQYDALLHGSSFFHSMNACIQARNKCIAKIKRELTRAIKFLNLFPKVYFGQTQQDQAYSDWVEVQGYMTVQIDQSIDQSIKILSSIFLDIYRLRDMTMYIVQTVHRWRVEIEEHLDRCQQHSEIRYYFQGKQLYEMVLEDTNFLWVSKLSNYIWLQVKQDPFMIRNLIHVQERSQKTVLQKYFEQILSPKNPDIIDKALKCFEMLIFKFKPKLSNRFQQEQMLIQNYLQMQSEKHAFDQNQNQSEVRVPQQDDKSLEKQKSSPSPDKKSKLSIRGWVFEKNVKFKTRQRINDIIQKHKKQSLVRPYNILNQNQKQSIALAYMSQGQKNRKKAANIFRRPTIASQSDSQRPFFSQGEDMPMQTARNKQKQRQFESQPERSSFRQSKMFKSLTKMGPVIYQDPKQHLPDTPKNKKIVPEPNAKTLVTNNIKINSFIGKEAISNQIDLIQVDEEETPLNMKQFFQVFRADTNKPRKDVQKVKQKSKEDKIISIKQFLEKARKERAKSMYNTRKTRVPLFIKSKKKNVQKSLQKSKSIDKSRLSYKGYTQIGHHSPPKDQPYPRYTSSQNQFIKLKPKSLPYDLIMPYVRHIMAQQHMTSKKFCNYEAAQIIKKLADPFINCIIFDLFTQKNEQIGQAILSESLWKGGKLKYTFQFLNIHTFQFIIETVLRISQELLAATPCLQVVCPFLVDKVDLVSTNFIQNLDRGLSDKVKKFGKLSILQRTKLTNTNSDIRERLYVFTSDVSLKKQYELGQKMMSNYRSLKIQCKVLVLTSNFRLKTKQVFKSTLKKYHKISIGQLYVRILSKVMTKYHLKQLKQASYSSQSANELTSLLRKDTFIRNVIQGLAHNLQDAEQKDSQQLLAVTGFNTIESLMNYLNYKKHDYYFHFKFLEQIKFMPNHELILAQFDQQVSIQFTLGSNQTVYIMHNHRKMVIHQVRSKNIQTQGYFLPTTNQNIKVFLMNAIQYKQRTTPDFDLYSYFSLFYRELHSDICLNQVPSIILPNLKKNNISFNKVSMFDGFFRLFPERQFYSAAMMNCVNHWQGYYPNAVLHTPRQGSLMFEYPFFIGLYDVSKSKMITVFLYDNEGDRSP